jgi:hypothetical protein
MEVTEELREIIKNNQTDSESGLVVSYQRGWSWLVRNDVLFQESEQVNHDFLVLEILIIKDSVTVTWIIYLIGTLTRWTSSHKLCR